MIDISNQYRQKLKFHHSALTRGYVSRKNLKGIIQEYNGKFGKGIKIYTPNFNSTRYCFVSYYIE